ncbi:MAG: 1-phosphofructokinase [Oscillospiraceae bacterium]|jgi:1-phosphofructokinase|nr:1-phosphofructokinase [Oscillospiraceae bacterium]
MIYTVTFNPAVDYVVHTGEIAMGGVNRTKSEEIYFGGKGINVSMVLSKLGIKSRALGFVAGFTGDAIEKGVAEQGIETDFVHLENGFSRINVKIKSGNTALPCTETELNGQGPEIDSKALDLLFDKIDNISDGDTIILAGSIPGSMPADIYEKILERLQNKNIKAVVDATKDLLVNVLKYKPFLVKPNNHELGEIFGVTLKTNGEIAEYAQKIKDMGARNVLVSMAGDGALLLDENGKKHICGVCKGTVKNSVGAGDSMVAGFVAGSELNDYEYALKLGTAAGGATAFSDGLAEKELIDELLKQLI